MAGAVLARCIEVARCCSGGGCIGQVYRDGQVLQWWGLHWPGKQMARWAGRVGVVGVVLARCIKMARCAGRVGVVGAVLARYIEMARCCSGGGCIGQVYRDGQVLQWWGLYWPGVKRWPGVGVVWAVLARCIEMARCWSGGGCIGQVCRDGQVLEKWGLYWPGV